MFFSKDCNKDYIIRQVVFQIENVLPVCDKGLDVLVVPHKDKRSNKQNRFLMVVMGHIIRFYNDTGFVPSGCMRREMRSDSLKEYWKDRLGVLETKRLSTTEISEFIDKIQAIMIQETGGEYEAISPDDAYLDSLCRSMM